MTNCPANRRATSIFARGRALRVLAVPTILLTGIIAFAQQPVGQDGRLFDANPQVGGGRVNLPRPGAGANLPGNYQATGNARFGQSLRSYSPISDPSAFRAPLGSASLSSFRRDSVSTADAYGGYGGGNYGAGNYYGGGYSGALPGVGRSQPYYDPSRTVATPTILNSQPLGLPLTTGLPQNRAPGSIDSGPGLVGVPGTRDPQDQRLDWRVNAKVDPNVATGQPSYRWQGTSSIFGMRPPTITPPIRRIDDQFNNASAVNPRGGLTDAVRPATNLTPMGEDRRPPGTSPIGSPADLVASGRNPPAIPNQRPTILPPQPTAAVASAGGQRDGARPGMTPGAPPPPRIMDPSLLPGFDAFTDMRLALALVRDPGASWFEEMKNSIRDNPSAAVQQQEVAQLKADDFINRVLKAPLRSFVGPGASALNNEMLKAESLMQIGQYYDAAGRYDAARTIDPNNPLPYMGKAHALLAAGEYYSAAVALVAGLERYPDVARFQIDLQSLVGGGEIVDIRRADIMERLKDNEDPRLRFLLGYLEYHSGNRDMGMKNLERAAAAVEAGSIVADYPKLLRGESRPPVPRGLQPRRSGGANPSGVAPSGPLPAPSPATPPAQPGTAQPPAGALPTSPGASPAAPGGAMRTDPARPRPIAMTPTRDDYTSQAVANPPPHTPSGRPIPQPLPATHVQPLDGSAFANGQFMPPPVLDIDPPRPISTPASGANVIVAPPPVDEGDDVTAAARAPGAPTMPATRRIDPSTPRDVRLAADAEENAGADDGVMHPVGRSAVPSRTDRVGGTPIGLQHANAPTVPKATSRPTSQPARPRPPTPSGDPELDIDAPRSGPQQ